MTRCTGRGAAARPCRGRSITLPRRHSRERLWSSAVTPGSAIRSRPRRAWPATRGGGFQRSPARGREPRAGTGAATVAGVVVSVGSEGPLGTSGAVYALQVRTGTWSRLPDLPTPRHGLGVVAFGRTVIAIGGGPRPGFTVTGANESLTLA